MIDLSKIYQPTERQRVFHSVPADIALYGGAAGGGKSEALMWEAYHYCLENPGDRALLLRRTFPELKRSLIDRALKKFPLQLSVPREGGKVWHFRNGSILEFGYCQREQDVMQYQSAEYGFIGFDELTHFTYWQWDHLVNSRLRSSIPGSWPRARAASNPGSVGHLWVKEMFVDAGEPDTVWEDEFGYKISFIPAKVHDNPHLLENDPLYVKRLQRLDEKWRRALLDGDWDVFAGQYFDMWDRDVHVIRDMSVHDIPRWWKRFRSLDYGLDMTACYWWAVAPDGRCILYRELYQPNLNLSQAAEAILDYTPRNERIVYTVASPDLWNRRQDRGVPGVQIMHEAGLRGLVKADHRRVPGWLAMREYLQPYEDEQGRLTAKLRFLESCKNAIRTIPSLVHDDKNLDDVNGDGEDHAAESIRYGVMSRPPKSVPMEEARKRWEARRRLVAPTVSSITGY